MNILITGICGFVGSTVAEALLDQAASSDLTITGIDNFSRNGSWLNRDRLQARGVRILHGDIRTAADLEAIGPFDWVIDAAANPSVLAGVDGKSSTRQLVENNLGGTINLLEACKRWKAGFILLSTSRVYSIPPLANLEVEVQDRAFHPPSNNQEQGTNNEEPRTKNQEPRTRNQELPGFSRSGISESFSTAPPVSLYGSTKITSELLALEYGLTFDFPVWINRCGVMAGARQFGKPDQGIFAFWLHSWREGRPLKYIGFDGLGHQVRDCLHPRDLAPLLVKQMATKNQEPGTTTPRVINLSGGLASTMSLRQLSDWCTERFPDSPTRDFLPPVAEVLKPEVRPFDLPWVVLDHSLATETWGWKPTTSVTDILEEIADFADQNPDWIAVSA
ncbi:NAD-dependent epimerase/dehydratase family protein [Haloferula chungangensis]|uniref:NAD-dependent epimerase/dehydratase family protein n=1 Tax=Haloferula chungangensis TaxID=1048331 RepID=A0ABW2L8T5_9BACT